MDLLILATVLLICAAVAGYVTALRRRLAAAEWAAVTDPLTALANREGLRRKFEGLVVSAGERDLIGAVLIDVDQFKAVNDSYGHSLGDDVLRHVGRRVESCRIGGRPAFPARLGGDEFAVLLRFSARDHVTGSVSDALASLVDRPVAMCGIHVRLSVGYAAVPASEADLGALLGKADVAMYRAKRAGGGLSAYHEVVDGPPVRAPRPPIRTRDHHPTSPRP